MKAWNLDQEILQEGIIYGETLAKNSKYSKSTLQLIKKEVERLRKFQRGEFESADEETKFNASLETLKTKLLYKLRRDYKFFNPNLINLIYEIYFQEPFGDEWSEKISSITMDDQARLTYKNYLNHANSVLSLAEFLLRGEENPCIQETTLETSSYVHYSPFIEKAFIIVDPNDCPHALNHELEHAIEYLLNINKNTFYSELGPILLELFYLDILYAEQGYLEPGDYGDRLNMVNTNVGYISGYFMLMQECALKNFKVSMAELEKLLDKYFACEPTEMKAFFNDVLGYDLKTDMGYLFSYLKALEIHELWLQKDSDVLETIKPLIRTRKFHFEVPDKPLKIYENYVENLLLKTR